MSTIAPVLFIERALLIGELSLKYIMETARKAIYFHVMQGSIIITLKTIGRFSILKAPVRNSFTIALRTQYTPSAAIEK